MTLDSAVASAEMQRVRLSASNSHTGPSRHQLAMVRTAHSPRFWDGYVARFSARRISAGNTPGSPGAHYLHSCSSIGDRQGYERLLYLAASAKLRQLLR